MQPIIVSPLRSYKKQTYPIQPGVLLKHKAYTLNNSLLKTFTFGNKNCHISFALGELFISGKCQYNVPYIYIMVLDALVL